MISPMPSISCFNWKLLTFFGSHELTHSATQESIILYRHGADLGQDDHSMRILTVYRDT